jgi:hypothetical protein
MLGRSLSRVYKFIFIRHTFTYLYSYSYTRCDICSPFLLKRQKREMVFFLIQLLLICKERKIFLLWIKNWPKWRRSFSVLEKYTYRVLYNFLCRYRNRVEIGGMYNCTCICPLSWSVHHNFVRDGRYSKSGWACTLPPHQPGIIFLS